MALGLAGFFVVPSSMKLILSAETWQGHLFGLAGMATFVGVAAALLYLRSGGRRAMVVAAACAASVALIAIVLAVAARGAVDGGAVKSATFRARAGRTLAFSDLLPEIDQVDLGISVARALDPLLDAQHADHARSVALPIYREMLAQPADYGALPSAMPFAYADVFYGGDNGAGQTFVYAPPHGEGEKLGALIFAHGSAGNFMSYIHVWRALADAERVVIICPTFGFGDWGKDEGLALLKDALAYAASDAFPVDQPIDPKRIFLAGLSQGGAGVTRVAPELASKLAGVILISPVLDHAALADARWKDLRVLVLEGEEDERVPRAYVERGVRDLERTGATVTFELFSGEDHFLFFSKRTEVLAKIGAFIRPATCRANLAE